MKKKYKYLILFLFPFFLYANTLGHKYVLDDDISFLLNTDVQKGIAGISDIFKSSYFHGFNNLQLGYRPITLSLFAFEYAIFGYNPFISHLINVLLFSLTCFVLFYILIRNTNLYVAWISTLLFITHPIHVEVVANVKSRDEILSFLFGLCCLIYALKYADEKKIIYLIYTSILYYASVLSKENGMTFAALVPLSVYFFKKEAKALKILSANFAIHFIAINAIYFMILGGNFKEITVLDNSLISASLYERFATSFLILGKYVMLVLLPLKLVYLYTFNYIPIVGWTNWNVILSFLFLITFTFYAIKKIKSKNIFYYGWLSFLISISIYSNLLVLSPNPMAERFAYSASFGGVIFFAGIINFINNRYSLQNKSIYYLLPTIILMLFSYQTYMRNKVWKTNYTLFSNDMKNLENCAQANYLLATEYSSLAKRTENINEKKVQALKAIQRYEKAIEIYPKYESAYNNMGTVYSFLGKYKEAIKRYEEVLVINPNYAKSYHNIGNVYLKLGDYEKAISNYKKAVEKNPEYIEAYINLSNAYYEQGRKEISIQTLYNALDRNPKDPKINNNIGSFYFYLKEYPKAIEYFEKAIKYNPNHITSYNNIIETYKQLGDYVSVNYYQRLLSEISKDKSMQEYERMKNE